MSVLELIQELENLGVRLWDENGQLHFRAPKGVLDADRRARLVAEKAAVLAHLRGDAPKISAHAEWRHEPFPLTEVQSAYLIGRRTGVLYGGVGCHAYGELRVEQLDARQLTSAWRYLIRRHDMLRAVISPDGTQQVLSEVPDYRIEVTDLRNEPKETIEFSLGATRASMDHRIFDPSTWPLFQIRVTLLATYSIIHFSIDLLIADYVSVFILLDEMRKLHEQPEAALPELSITFRDYLLEIRKRQSDRVFERARSYWMNRLANLPPAPDLPVLHALSVPPQQSSRFRRWEFALDSDDVKSLARHAGIHGLPLSGAVLAAYAEVIGRWSRHQHFTLNLTLLNRPPLHPDVARLVGDFTSVALLEVDHTIATSYVQRAKLLQQELGKTLDHSQFTGIEVIRELVRHRGMREAIMPIVFTSMIGLDAVSGRTPIGEYVRGLSQTPQVWIDCQVNERGGRLFINWDVREDVFHEGLVETMIASFRSLLRDLANEPATWDLTCPLPIPTEQTIRRAALVRSTIPLPDGTLFSGALTWARSDPGRKCVFTRNGTLGYGELLRHACGVQLALQQRGIRPGEIVAVFAEGGPIDVIAVLGILLAGGAYLPIGRKEPKQRRDEIMMDAGVRLAICRTRLDLAPSIAQIISDSLRPTQDLPSPAVVSPDQMAYVIYTSGSTGRPKGVMITHRSALNTINDINRRFEVDKTDRLLSVSSLAFDLSVYDIFGLLSAGGGVVFPDPDRLGDPSDWTDVIGQFGVTVWNSVPSLMGMLQEYLVTRSDVRLSSLRLGLLSGDRIPVELVRQSRVNLPQMNLVALGGATECSIWSIYYLLCDLPANATFVPYGRPLGNQTVQVVDDAMRPTPDNVTGEIVIGGAGLAIGYLGDEPRTRERFVSDPTHGKRLYRTGDLGRFLPDGNIEILGREDSQVKIRGYRVELGEVEATLSSHPLVAKAVVAFIGAGGERQRLQAFVEPKSKLAGPIPPIMERIEEVTANALVQIHPAKYFEYLRLLDLAALGSMMDVFRRVGLFVDGGVWTYDQITTAIRSAPRYYSLIRRWLRAAVGSGMLECLERDHAYRSTENGRALSTNNVWDTLAKMRQQYDSPVLLDYFRECGTQLPDLISGERSALSMLYPQGRFDIARALNEDSFLNRWGNSVTAAAVNCVAEEAGSNRCLRILEMGAGIGATTASILRVLREPYEYWFTDITQYFLNAARLRFAENKSLRFELFDLNRGPGEQGIAPNSFDIVIAADVIHIAENVPRILSYIREMLTAGGWLVALEMTRDHYQIMTSLELVNTNEQRDRIFDDERQGQHKVFYSYDEWIRLLGESEADVIVGYPTVGSEMAEIGLSAFAARYKSNRVSLNSTELSKFLSDRLPAFMIPSDIYVVDHLPLTENGKIDRKRLSGIEISNAAPRHEDEQLLSDLNRRVSKLWTSVLKLSSVRRDIDFFAAGGDSLLAAQLTGRLLEEIPEAGGIFFDELLRRILEGPTLAELADAICETPREAANSEAESEVDSVTWLGGGLGHPVCFIVHDNGFVAGEVEEMWSTLAAQFRLFGLSVRRSDQSNFSKVAASCLAWLQREVIDNIYVVGVGLGNVVAIEIVRQMLECDLTPSAVTLVSLNGYDGLDDEYAMHGLHYGGDASLICLRGNAEADAFWRNVCLGGLRTFESESLEGEKLAKLIAHAFLK